MPIGLDSTHFMAEIIGSPRAPLMIALSEQENAARQTIPPVVWH